MTFLLFLKQLLAARSRHAGKFQRTRNATFPSKNSTYPPPRYERVVTLAGSQRVFVESPSQSVALPKCQPAFAVLPFTLDLTRSPLVAAMSVFCFFFVISSQVPSDPMSNYTPATNLITVAEEIA